MFLSKPTFHGALFPAWLLALGLSGCGKPASDRASPTFQGLPESRTGAASRGDDAAGAAALDLVLQPVPGEGAVEKDIRRQQTALDNAPRSRGALERLGWLFVSKARWSHDPGYLLKAEKCAELLERLGPGSAEALLLKGHADLNLHRFAHAESSALRLASMRGSPYDFGLLGDALMEQGKLTGALAAYQKMLDMKPGFQAYSRAAHLRWLKGDLRGALELMEMTIRAGSPRDPDAMAWAHARLALYRFQAGQSHPAREAIRSALAFRPDYPPALAVQGRMIMAEEGKAEGRMAEAIGVLRKAVLGDGLPEYRWALAECLREAGRGAEADQAEMELRAVGEARDPRTLALFLSGRAESPGRALALCRRERSLRGDVHTHDALAWALYASGDMEGARAHADSALAEGTQDARILLHAGMVSQALGRAAEACIRLDAAAASAQMLLPSERKALRLARMEAIADTRSARESMAMPGRKLR